MIRKEVNIDKVEKLLQMATSDFSDYGARESQRESYLNEWRKDIGYSLEDLKE